MSIATDVRAYADLALEQGKAALSQANKRLATDAPKPVLAALGAADLLAEALGKQAEALGRQAESFGKRVESLPELPAAAAGNLAKAQESGKTLLDRAQDDALARLGELRERLDASLESVRSLPSLPVIAAGTTSGYLDNARQVFGGLTARGEARLADLRKDPRVTRLLGDLDGTASALNARIAPVLGSVRSELASDLDSAAEAIKDSEGGSAKPRARKAPAAKSTSARPARATSGTTARAKAGTTARAKAGTTAPTKSGTTRRTAAKKA
jgi:hypothetical protein